MVSIPRRLAVVTSSAALFVGLVAPSPALAAPIVRNGGFETGDTTGWNVSNVGNGTWMVYDEPGDPNGFEVIHPPRGSFAIVTSQTGPGSHLLHQKVRLPEGQRLRLRFILWYRSGAPIAVRDTLSYKGAENQQFRMDILRVRAPLWSLDSNDILATAFRTRVGDPKRFEERLIRENLSRFAGRTVRLRFAEVDNQDFFQVVIDAVRIV
jgi:hypothetical protein